MVQLSGDELDDVPRPYPDSLVEQGTVYLHDNGSECQDTFTIEMDGKPVNKMVAIRPVASHDEKVVSRGPVERTLAAVNADWYDNDGSS